MLHSDSRKLIATNVFAQRTHDRHEQSWPFCVIDVFFVPSLLSYPSDYAPNSFAFPSSLLLLFLSYFFRVIVVNCPTCLFLVFFLSFIFSLYCFLATLLSYSVSTVCNILPAVEANFPCYLFFFPASGVWKGIQAVRSSARASNHPL